MNETMDVIAKIREKARAAQKTIILPEGYDSRVRRAAEYIRKEGLARVVLLDRESADSVKAEQYAQIYFELRRKKGVSLEEARAVARHPVFYGASMVREGIADGFVAGAATTTSDVIKAALYCLGLNPELQILTSCFIMVVPDCRYGEDGVFIFADCGVIPEPSTRQLALIALCAADVARRVLGLTPRVAMLSYSTHGSAAGGLVERIREATAMARELAPGLLIDGELQVDAALVADVARMKNPESPIQGNANVLVFPNLEAGNIAYKLVERLTRGRAVGPLFLGTAKPCSDLSRGCGWEDVVDAVAVTAVMAEGAARSS